MTALRTLVISDIHVGAGELDDCDEQLESKLVEFFEFVANGPPTELVINGDFLDFAQAPPISGPELEARSETGQLLCFTEAQSLSKLDAIIADHPRIGAALGSMLAANSQHRLVVLPGNHDADFFWPSVRTRFVDWLRATAGSSAERAFFHLEQVYRPNGIPVWIEHGHQYDPVNRFYAGDSPAWSQAAPPIARDTSGTARLLECTGTRFMVRFMNELDRTYPFVDNIKPFSKFLRLFGTSALVPGHGPLKALVATWGMLRYLGKAVATSPSDLLSLNDDGASPGEHLASLTGALSKEQQAQLNKAAQAHGFAGSFMMQLKDPDKVAATLAFLADHLELAEMLEPHGATEGLLSLDGTGDGTLSLGKEFSADDTQRLKDQAKAIRAKEDVAMVVMGHTHELVDEPGYLNLGSWTRYYRAAHHEKLPSWDTLRQKTYELFPYELRYVELIPGHPALSQLKVFAVES